MVDNNDNYFSITPASNSSIFTALSIINSSGFNTSLTPTDVDTNLTTARSNDSTNQLCFTNSYIRSAYPIAVPIMLFFCILSIFLNLIIVLSTRWCRKPMTPTLYLSISLALADLFTSLILAAGLIVNSLMSCIFNIDISLGGGKCFKLAVETSRLGAISSTVVHLLALGINHWIGIIRPLHYAAIMTRRAAWMVILLSWFCPMFLIFIYFSIPGRGFLSEKCNTTEFLDEFPWRAVYVSSFFVPLLVMSLIYLHIYVIVKKHNQYRLRYQSSQQLQRNVKAVITTVLILGTYIIGWMPALLWYILVCKNCTFKLEQIQTEVAVPVNFVINTLIILKALVNPIIYAARMSDIKTALNKMRYEFLSRCFGNYFQEEPPQDPLERGSLCETRSLRVSSRGSSSGSRRAGGSNSLNSTLRSHRTTNSYNSQGNSNGNGNNNQDTLEMMEWK